MANYILVGDAATPANSIRFNFDRANSRAAATLLYNAMYESTTPRDPAAPNADRQAAFGGTVLNYSPFIANYYKAPPVLHRNFVWRLSEVGGLPTTVAALEAYQKPLNQECIDYSVQVHQRGFAFTSGDSIKYYLNTQSMSPCITIIVWNRARQTAALAHVDKLQNFKATVDKVFEKVTGTPDEPVHVHFHGGNCTDRIGGPGGIFVSTNTATELIKAILERPDSESIRISTLDVVLRPHGNSVAFNTRTGRVSPEIGEATPFQLDSLYRYARVQNDFKARFPEEFYAEIGGTDPLSQFLAFNRSVGGMVDQTTANRALFPLDPDSLLQPRLQTDLRIVDTARPPLPTIPLMAFLDSTKMTLFNWAKEHLVHLANAAVKENYPLDDIYKMLCAAVDVDSSPAPTPTLDQAKKLHPKLAYFERIVRRGGKPEEEGFVGYLQTLANAMNAGRRMSDLKDVSKAWIKQYVPA